LDEIEQVLAIRTPLYAEAADWEIDTERAPPSEIAAAIADWLANSTAVSAGRG
jgi:shikimate kinase